MANNEQVVAVYDQSTGLATRTDGKVDKVGRSPLQFARYCCWTAERGIKLEIKTNVKEKERK